MIKKESKNLLYGNGKHSGVPKAKHAHHWAHHRENLLIHNLEKPCFHSVRLDASNCVSGFAFDSNSRPLRYLKVYRDDSVLGSFPADRPSGDVSSYVPHVATARNCRFEFDLFVDSRATRYKLEAVYDDQRSECLSTYEIAAIRSMQRWFNEMSEGLGRIAVPNCDLVYMTQGIRDTKAYKDSIIPGIYTLKRYLSDCGVQLGRLGSLLDFGCGTGRLLVGWYLDDPRRNLHGCDINGELIRWAKTNLPGNIVWDHTTLAPPLPYASKSLDLVLAVSVFTHLSSMSQESWIKEFKRVLSPGGYVLITLHGDTYVRLIRAQKLKEFEQTGYIEDASTDEGSNSYAAFHGYEFVERLFEEFEIVGYFPQGNTYNRAALSRVAAFQDVYVLKGPS